MLSRKSTVRDVDLPARQMTEMDFVIILRWKNAKHKIPNFVAQNVLVDLNTIQLRGGCSSFHFLHFIYLFLSFSFYRAIHFSHSMSSSPLLYGPKLPIDSGDLVFFTFYVDTRMTLLAYSLLSRFSEIVDCRLVLLCFMSKSHLGVNAYDICLSGSGLPHPIWFFLDPSICLQISRCYYFSLLCSTLLYSYKGTTFSLFMFWLKCV